MMNINPAPSEIELHNLLSEWSEDDLSLRIEPSSQDKLFKDVEQNTESFGPIKNKLPSQLFTKDYVKDEIDEFNQYNYYYGRKVPYRN